MSLRWEDEAWIKLYTRDTVDWLSLSFEAQALWVLLLRKCDGAGIIHLGRRAKRGIAAAIGHVDRWETIEPAIDELLEDGCLVIEWERAIAVNFVEAQQARTSDKARKAAQRQRDHAKALSSGQPESQPVAGCHAESHDVTQESHAVTPGHAASHDVTIRRDKIRSEEIREEEKEDVASAVAPASPAEPSAKKPVTKPKRERTPSFSEAFVAKLLAARTSAYPDAPATPVANQLANARLGAATALGKALRERGEAAFLAAFDGYLADAYWRQQSPPCPVSAFLADSQWPRFLAAAPKPTKPGLLRNGCQLVTAADAEAAYPRCYDPPPAEAANA